MADAKTLLGKLLLDKAFEELPSFSDRYPSAVRKLFALTYDRTPLLRWRAVIGFGILARSRPEKVDRTLSRLAYALNDEASTYARMVAAVLGEMTAANPSMTDRVVRMGVHYLGDEETCHGPNRNVEILVSVLWGAGRTASVRPDIIAEIVDVLRRLTWDPEPDVRGHALWVLAQAGLSLDEDARRRLLEDRAMVALFDPESAEFVMKPVAAYAESVGPLS